MTKRILILQLLFLIWGSHCVASEQETAQWIVVTPPAFRESLKPLVDHRLSEGFKTVVVETTEVLNVEQIQQGNAGLLKEYIHRLCRDFKGPNYVLLVGAAQASEPGLAEKTVVPPLRGTVGRMNGQLSDNGYGCLGQDMMPTVAVGRFPARNAEEVRQMVQKTLKMEKDGLSGSWHNRLVMILGNPGGNSWLEKRLVDAYVQNAAMERFGRLHPLWEGRSIIHCSGSPFYVPNESLQNTSLKFFEEGEFFSFYLGHSDASSFWSDGVRFMDREAWSKLKIPQGQGVLFTCGCYACQLSGMGGEGYGLVAIRNPDGPAAVIGAHAETYAAMGQLALDGILKRFSSPPATARLADYWLAVKAGLDHGEIDAMTFQMLDQADGSRGKTPLSVQRQEHQEMWMLLGDPAMQLSFPPQDIRLEVAPSATPGERIVVKGILPDRLAGATVRVTLLRPMGSLPQSLEALPDKPAEKRARIMAENHRRANDLVLDAEEIKSTGNAFECSLELPGKITSKKIIVQAYSAREKEAAYGIAILPLKTEEKAQKTEKPEK
jgi:hypothetical protein